MPDSLGLSFCSDCFFAFSRLSHKGSSNTLSPSGSTSLSHFSSSDFSLPAGNQLTSPRASGLSTNSSSTNQALAYLGNQHGTVGCSPAGPVVYSPAGAVGTSPALAAAKTYTGPNPMAGQDWLPQGPVLAAHLAHVKSEPQTFRARNPVDFMDGMWGFEDFPPVPGMT